MSAAIFISPHLDDAVLSCGGGIARLTGLDERVTVVTVFTGDQSPGEPLSKLAVRSHASWAAGDQPFAARRAEDLEALGRLGATAEHLGLLDAIYRRSAAGHPLYADSLGTPTAEDLEYFLPQLVMALRNSAAGTGAAVAADAPGAPGTRHMATRVFCPAGTGGHVDHILTRVAVERVAEPESIVYFDEYPYVTRDGVSQSGGAQAGPDSWPTRTLPLSAEELEARIDAAGFYASQLRGLFPSEAERWREIASARLPVVGAWVARPPDVAASHERMAAQVRRDTELLGGERYRWWPEGPAPFPGI